ncbi:19686_t:CDS:1, partial [Racocetra persica]
HRIQTNLTENKADLCDKSSILIETEPTNLETSSLSSINDSSFSRINAPPKNVEVNELAKDIENEPAKDIENKHAKNIKNKPAKDIENESSDKESDSESVDIEDNFDSYLQEWLNMLKDEKQRFENKDIDDEYMNEEEHFINDNTHPAVDTNVK